jgi:hypothetical protein
MGALFQGVCLGMPKSVIGYFRALKLALINNRDALNSATEAAIKAIERQDMKT